MATQYCEIPDCGRELRPGCGSHGGLMICDRCRSCRYYWRAKGADAIKERRNLLRFWNQRFDYLSPYLGHIKRAKAKVLAIKARVRAAA
jgi:hypothetical protein